MRCITSTEDTEQECICTKDANTKTEQTKPSWQSEDLASPGCHGDPHLTCICPSHSPLLSPRPLSQPCISTVACQAFCCRALCSITMLIVAVFVQEHTANACNTQNQSSVPCMQYPKAQFCAMHFCALYTLAGRARQAHAQVAFISSHHLVKS